MNPENLNLSELPWLPIQAMNCFPSAPSIYFVLDAFNQVPQYFCGGCCAHSGATTKDNAVVE